MTPDTCSIAHNIYLTTGAICREPLTKIVERHRYGIVCHLAPDSGHSDTIYTVGLGQLLLPELYIKLPTNSPLAGTEIDIIQTIIAQHRDREITVGDIIDVPDHTNHTTHEFSAIPVSDGSTPLPGLTAVFPHGPSWTVEIFTSECYCPYCSRHRHRR